MTAPRVHALRQARTSRSGCGGSRRAASKPLYPRYDLAALADTFRPELLHGREPTLWRYAEVLPVRDRRFRITLGEGSRRCWRAPRLAARLGVERLWLKDEGQNPTAASRRAAWHGRGAGVGAGATRGRAAVGGQRRLGGGGVRGGGGPAVPRRRAADTPRVIVEETRALGADLELIDGLITDAGARVAEGAPSTAGSTCPR
jgi:threonine synthase